MMVWRKIPDATAIEKVLKEEQIKTGYILEYVGDATSIIINKGGQKSMSIKTITKARPSFEHIFDELNDMKANLDSRKELAKTEALVEVEKRFEEESTRIDAALAAVSVSEEIEVPDIVEEQVEVHETIDEQEENAQ